MLAELITEGWYSQAPQYLKRAFDERSPGTPGGG
jgi:hypothetical protein